MNERDINKSDMKMLGFIIGLFLGTVLYFVVDELMYLGEWHG